jgi:hypothetical protein
MTDRNPESWLLGLASRNAPDFVPNQYHVPYSGGSTKFCWLADVFTMDEFEEALDQCNNSAPLDGRKFIMFKFLPKEAKRYLLRIFNEIRSTGMIPESWLKTKVVPILKPRKDPELSDSYYLARVNIWKRCCKPVWIIGLKNLTYCRLASMVFEKAGGQGIVDPENPDSYGNLTLITW